MSTILITGATDGLGRGIAQTLARRDGTALLLHGRDRERGEALASELGATFYQADFARLDEVRAMGATIAHEQPRLDVLVNNAGIGTTLPGDGQRMESDDGYELRFQVNYLAGFLLTRLLHEKLIDSAPSRVINVSSAGQMPIDFDDVMLERDYSGVRAYCQSKLAQILFTFDLADELGATGVSAACLHPATYMPTKIVLHARGSAVSTLEEGIEATIALIDAPAERVNGRYFNGLKEARPDEQAYDPAARLRLRELSEELTTPPAGGSRLRAR
jgi:NAD(P)-dependent dehydrogenase (short-subunit alcohol dehydrogenase family)